MLKMSYFFKLKMPHFRPSAQAGMSLIETAMGIIVLGLIVLPIFRMSHVNYAKKVYDTNLGTLNVAKEGINQYFVSGNAAYPCPADLSLKPGDADFGKAGNCTLASTKKCSNPTWFNIHGGICKTDNTANAIIIGGLPFSDLKMSQEDSFDFWGNKLIYAVTHSQTDGGTYTANGGKIKIMSVDDPELVAAGPASDPDRDGAPDLVTGLYDIFIFSTGKNGVGGYSNNGLPLSACGGPADGYEYENCDYDNIFFALQDPNNDKASAYTEVRGANYFDDITSEQQALPIGTWFQHEDNPLYVNKDFVLTQATKVGVGTTTPTRHNGGEFNAVNLMVDGDIRADTAGGNGGHLQSSDYCDDSDPASKKGNNCFQPEIITDALDEMNCIEDTSYASGAVRAVKNISDNTVYCGSGLNKNGTLTGDAKKLIVDKTKFKVKDCASIGRVAAGIDVNGDLVCVVHVP